MDIENVADNFECFEDEVGMEAIIPTTKEWCFKCGASKLIRTITWHEPLMGAKYRSLSLKYKLQVPLCIWCHEWAQTEPSQEYNKSLQILMQKKFEQEHPDKSFLKVFGRNYIF